MTLQAGFTEFGGAVVGFLLTLFVFSFVLRDNPLYRVAVHLLVGVSAGYAIVVTVQEILLPVIETITSEPGRPAGLVWIVPLLLAILLLLKAIPRISWVGNSSMAILIGVGAAVGLVGAIVGTLFPQVTARYESGLLGLFVALLSILALAYFHFSGRAPDEGRASLPRWFEYVRSSGRVVITITLAGLFTGVLSTSLVLLTERVGLFVELFTRMFASFTSG
jgi:hypothetical protein